jgi:hypothetical protein
VSVDTLAKTESTTSHLAPLFPLHSKKAVIFNKNTPKYSRKKDLVFTFAGLSQPIKILI